MYDEIKNVKDQISVVENKTKEAIANWNIEMDTPSNRINTQINNLETSLTNKMTLKIDNLGRSLTDMIRQDINTASSGINVRIDNLDTNLPSRINTGQFIRIQNLNVD